MKKEESVICLWYLNYSFLVLLFLFRPLSSTHSTEDFLTSYVTHTVHCISFNLLSDVLQLLTLFSSSSSSSRWLLRQQKQPPRSVWAPSPDRHDRDKDDEIPTTKNSTTQNNTKHADKAQQTPTTNHTESRTSSISPSLSLVLYLELFIHIVFAR